MIDEIINYARSVLNVGVDVNNMPMEAGKYPNGQKIALGGFADLLERQVYLDYYDRSLIEEKQAVCCIAHELGHIIDFDVSSPMKKSFTLENRLLFNLLRCRDRSISPGIASFILENEEKAWKLGWAIIRKLDIPITSKFFIQHSENCLDSYRIAVMKLR